MNLTNIKVSIFKDLKSYESRPVGLQEVLWYLQNDRDVENKTALYRNLAKTITRDEANKKVKDAMMPAFSVAVLFNGSGKQTTHVTQITGLAICDIDHVESDKMDEVRKQLMEDSHVLLFYTTISGTGFRVIYWYEGETANPPEMGIYYRAAYKKGNEYFAKLCGVDYDGQCGNITRLSGMAHDANAFLNDNAEPFKISDDEAAAANLAADTEPGKRRREDAEGSHHAEVEAAWVIIEPMLTKRNITYGQGTHHQYVMHATHLFNRFGVSVEDLIEWANQNWNDYDQKARESVIHWVYQHRQREHGTWRLNKRGRKGEVSMITLPEICEWLASHKVEVIYNQITDQTLYLSSQTSEWKEMDEMAICTIRKEMAAETGKRVLKNDVMDVIRSNYAHLIHPVRDYLNSLPDWDGKDRVKELVSHLTAIPVQEGQNEAEAQEELLWAFHKWHVASMATWLNDDASNHSIFVLIGPQGIYKTTFFRYLLPPNLRSYFWENAHNSFSAKDDHIALTENCLVEIEEIDMFKDKDNAELKALSTAIKVKIRRPYGRFALEKHRLASFCGTGNQEKFLNDETGNRRWLCFLISHIDDPREWNMDYDQLYAQLRDEYRNGFQHWFTQEDQRRVERQNDYFRIISDEEELITMRFRKPEPGDINIKHLKASNIAQMLSYGRPPLSTRKVGPVMRRLGFKWEHTKSGNAYRVFEMTQEQSQQSLCMKIETYNTDNQTDVSEQELPF